LRGIPALLGEVTYIKELLKESKKKKRKAMISDIGLNTQRTPEISPFYLLFIIIFP
jgi:hypothetical protein